MKSFAQIANETHTTIETVWTAMHMAVKDRRRLGVQRVPLSTLMRANGFKEQKVRDKDGDTIAITYTRGDLPESFAKLF